MPKDSESWFAQLVQPPGIQRMREQVYREIYNRERAMEVTTDDGVSWPVDLGEAGA